MQSFYTTEPKELELSLLINRLIICDVMFHLYIDIQKRLRMEAVKGLNHEFFCFDTVLMDDDDDDN